MSQRENRSRVDKFIEVWFDFPQPFAAEEQGLDNPAQEEDGQMKIKIDEEMVVEADEERPQVEHAQLKPEGEQVEQGQGEGGVVHLVREVHHPPKENQLEVEIRF